MLHDQALLPFIRTTLLKTRKHDAKSPRSIVELLMVQSKRAQVKHIFGRFTVLEHKQHPVSHPLDANHGAGPGDDGDVEP